MFILVPHRIARTEWSKSMVKVQGVGEDALVSRQVEVISRRNF